MLEDRRVVLMGEKLRFSLLNRLHSPGGRQGPHCAPEIGPIKAGGSEGVPAQDRVILVCRARSFQSSCVSATGVYILRGVVGAAL